MVKDDVAVQIRLFVVRRRALRLGVQDLAQALGRDGRLREFRQRPPERAHGAGKRLRVADEREQLAERHAPVRREIRADADDAQHLKAAGRVAHAPEQAERVAHVDPLVGKRAVLFVKFVKLIALAPKRAHDAHARQVFLHLDRQLALGLVGDAEEPVDARMEKQRVADDDRDEQQADGGKRRVHGEHEHNGDGQQNGRPHDLDALRGNKVADDLNVRCAALDHVARLVLRMPGKRQILDVPEQRPAQRADEPLRPLGDGHARKVIHERRERRADRHAERAVE